ncbi:hypothetical protein [Gynuella sunshinyii]|uniref:Uncharacterized protein n=1 Tax=Gynuella sunshinyii YC6258 TaxID=1445510 RepID=A0A0C5VDE0_9GAMM|nr:hypothetical protein [Gynuella sunshinyii]AJQ97345.1 hypothetical Protein YC6258_05315 [Gynuella sunshinyii YC6258]
MFKEMHDADVSVSLISKVKDAVIDQVIEWQSLLLEMPWMRIPLGEMSMGGSSRMSLG